MTISRRALIGAALPVPALGAPALGAPALGAPALGAPALGANVSSSVRVGTLRFGTVAWELDVVRAHAFDIAEGVRIEPLEFASAQATQVALQAGRVDMVLQDWLWVSRQRDGGADWTFVPSTSAVGGIVVPEGSPVRGLADLVGRRLGVAGGPLDKSWLVLRAYAGRMLGLDLDARVEKTFGAPPLLAEQLRAGRLDAVLNYWPFVARAEAQGYRRVFAIEEAVAGLGISARTPVLGWTFSEGWARRPASGVRGFLRAVGRGREVLARSDAAWERIGSMTGAGSPAELVRLRDWYRRGLVPEQGGREDAARLYDVLAEIGGPALVGDAKRLAPGTFWEGDANPT